MRGPCVPAVANPERVTRGACGAGQTTLFVPRLPAEYAVWMGKILSCAEFRAIYAVDDCKYVDELPGFLKAANGPLIAEGAVGVPPPAMGPAVTLYTLHGKNTDSGAYAQPASFAGIEDYRVDNGRLFPLIVELRVFKTEAELEVRPKK